MAKKKDEELFEERLGAAIGRTAGFVFRMPLSLLEQGAQFVGLMDHRIQGKPGARAGIDLDAPIKKPAPQDIPDITVIDYDADTVRETEVEDLDEFLETGVPPLAVRWINVHGLELSVVTRIARAYGMHPLAAEDVLHVPQRPKHDDFDDSSFIVSRMLRIDKGDLVNEQVSFFITDRVIVTFQQIAGDCWDGVRSRIRRKRSPMRGQPAGHLAYVLLDAIVDHCFPVLEHYGDRLEQLENELVRDPEARLDIRIHALKRELLLLRRVLWPMRELISSLREDQPPWMPPETLNYMRDIQDHIIRAIELLETFREVASGLSDLYLNQQSHKMNEIMKVLTIMASLFIPITFIAGVYGMNFEHMPELHTKYGYYIVWGLFIVVTGALLLFFRHKKWL